MAAQNYTLSYSERAQGWPSFYSFIPEYTRGMNAYLYTFSGGNLYRHNTNETRNQYYGVNYNSEITSVFNPEPTLTIKLFKTLSYESDDAWDCTSLVTDLSQGNVDELNFKQKEGEWYSYVRHNDGVTNYKLRYTNGLGVVSNVSGLPDALVVTIAQGVGELIAEGATVYVLTDGQDPVLAGQVTNTGSYPNIDAANNQITIDTTITGATAPIVGDFLMFTNNTIAESYGMRGYYMEFKLVNNNTEAVELFSVGSSVMKSYP